MQIREKLYSTSKRIIYPSADEFTRLEMQADLFRDDARAMLARIGNGSGWHVLDLCCGIGGITDVLSEWVGNGGSVVGADLDAPKLKRAREWIAQQGMANVTFVEANAFDSGLQPGSFDLVHARFALSVIRNGLGILDHLVTLVRPDGIVFVEEVNTRTMECIPSTADWERGLAVMEETFVAIGADTKLGPTLRAEFHDRGLVDIAVKPCLHALCAADPMTMHMPNTLAAMRETITSLGLMEGQELDGLVARVSDHLAQPQTMTISFTMMQVVGRMAD